MVRRHSMGIQGWLALMLALVLAWCAWGAPAVAQTSPLTIKGLTPRVLLAVADPWCPYNCVPGSPTPGLMVEALQLALAPYGYTVNYTNVPWVRALNETLAGTYDVVIGTDPVEGAKLRLPSYGFVCGYAAYTLADKAFTYTGPASLVGKRVGGAKGYHYGPEIQAYLDKNRGLGSQVMLLAGADTLPRNLQKLQAERLDVLLENPYVLAYNLQQARGGMQLTKIADTLINQCFTALAPNKPDSAALQQLIGQRFGALEADGTMAKLRTKYGL